jgi:outer membrane protein OmpA-like peptidoglycan-associated protein
VTTRGLQLAIVGCAALGVADVIAIAGYLAPAAYPGLRGERAASSAVGGEQGATALGAKEQALALSPSLASKPKAASKARVALAASKARVALAASKARVAPAASKARVAPAASKARVAPAVSKARVAPAASKAPVAPPVPRKAPVAPAPREGRLKLVGEVFFGTDSYALDQRARREARRIVQLLRRLPVRARVELRGHADIRGTDRHNKRLSRLRTITVHYYLRRIGALARLKTRLRYFGSRRARQSDDPARHARDRRVRVFVERSGR